MAFSVEAIQTISSDGNISQSITVTVSLVEELSATTTVSQEISVDVQCSC